MLRTIVFIFSLFTFYSLKAQNITSFTDYLQKFYVFEDGALTKLEHLPIQGAKASDDYLAYVDNVSNFKAFYQGEKYQLEGVVDSYTPYKGFVLYKSAGIIKVFSKGEKTVLSPQVASYKASDGMVAYIDLFDRAFKIFTDTVHVLEMHSSDDIINSYRVMNGTMAYVDAMDNFYYYRNGERQMIIDAFEGNYNVGGGIVAFEDNYDFTFKAFYNDEIVDLDAQYPRGYRMGNSMVAWVSANETFYVFHDGEIVELSTFQPTFYTIKDDLMSYFINGYFYLFYKGEVIEVSPYKPSEYFMDNQTLVYRDQQGFINAYIDGKFVEITRQPSTDLKLNGDVIYYTVNGNEPRVFYKGQEVEY